MRNSNTKVRCEKLSLSKCPGVCRTYSNLQLAYAKLLQDDDNIVEFRCNVPLESFELTDGAYTTDFVCTTITGEVVVRECVKKTLIERPKTTYILQRHKHFRILISSVVPYLPWSAALYHEWIRKKQMDMRKKKGRAAKQKKMEKEMMGENEEICLLENI